MRRRNVPCSPCSGGTSSGDCCGLKEKLRILWDRTIGSILRINGITPDGDGNFTIEAGSNIALSETGTGNGIRIDTTGGVSYYESGDSYVNVDNNDLEISVNVGTGGLATDTDLQTVAQAVTDILDGTSTVPEATHATSADNATNAGYADNAGNATYAGNATNALYLGSVSSNVGTDTKPIKIVNGQAVAVTNELIDTSTSGQVITGYKVFNNGGNTGIFIMNPNLNVYQRPPSYYFTEINFTGVNNEPYITLRATMDAQGSRRIEVNLRDINGVDHWSTLASRTD